MILGAVLAGGRSSRFGSDKAAALWQGRALADHAAAALTVQVSAVIRVGGKDGLPDRPGPGHGPLGGVAAALAYAAAHGFSDVLTIACDMPVAPPELLAELMRQAPAYCEDAPVLGAWPVSALAMLDDLLAATNATPGSKDGPSIRRFAQAIGATAVTAAAPLPNINTPADLHAL